MGCGTIFAVIVALVSALVVLKVISSSNEAPTLPKLEDTWWGPKDKDPSKEDTSVKPFKISITDEALADLKKRLYTARPFTPPLEGIAQEYGMNTNLLKRILHFWTNKYNWREREKFFNQYPQFKVSVQGLNIHYLHVKPTETQGLKVLPLLLLHGWPGSIREFYEIIPLLTTPQKGRNFVFEVIVPSLPGYGFSDAAAKPGLGVAQIAVVFKNFMARLGYEKYYLQGGDWGGLIVQHMATLYPDKVIAVHSNTCVSNTPISNLKLFLYSFWPSMLVSEEHVDKVYPLSKKLSFMLLESGYLHIQATKPDTVGVGLNDSPVGLAAYIFEKFTTWTNPEWTSRMDGGMMEKFTYTQILDNVMIYWITGSITTSARLYAESLSKDQTGLGLDSIPITVPSGCSRHSHDLLYAPENILKDKHHNLVHISDLDGGHFAAFEVPKQLAEDIYTFIEKVNK